MSDLLKQFSQSAQENLDKKEESRNTPAPQEQRDAVKEYSQNFLDFVKGRSDADLDAAGISEQSAEARRNVTQSYHGDRITDTLSNIGKSALEAAGGTLAGGLHNILGSEGSKWLSEATTLDRSDEHTAELDERLYLNEQYNKGVQRNIDSGELSQEDGEYLMFKNMMWNTSFEQVSDGIGAIGGSVLPVLAATVYGGPAVASAAWTAMAGSALGEVGVEIRDEIFKRDSQGNFEFSHEDLLEHSPVYQKAFEETGSEVDAREEVFKAIRLDAQTDPRVLTGTAIEVLGEYGFLKLAKILPRSSTKAVTSTAKKGAVRSFIGNQTKGGLAEGIGEGSGSLGRTLGANIALREVDPDRSAVEGVHEVGHDVMFGLGSGPVVTAGKPIVMAPRVISNVYSGRGESQSDGSMKSEDFKKQATAIAEQLEKTPLTPAAFKPTETPETEGAEAGSAQSERDKEDPETRRINDQIERLGSFFQATENADHVPENLRGYVTVGANKLNQLEELAGHALQESTSPEDVVAIGMYLSEASDDLGSAVAGLLDYLPNVKDEGTSQAITYAGRLHKGLTQSTELLGSIAKAKKIVDEKTIQKDEAGKLTEEGVQTVKEKLSLSPETLIKDSDAVDLALDAFDSSVFSESERDKLKLIRNMLDTQRELDQSRADMGFNNPSDIVGREITSDYEEGSKGASVLRHAMDIMDAMRAGNLNTAKASMGKLQRFNESHANKLTAILEGNRKGESEVEYETYGKNSVTKTKAKFTIAEGGAPQLVDKIATEVAFMQDVYNKLANAYEGIGKPLPVHENAVKLPDTPTRRLEQAASESSTTGSVAPAKTTYTAKTAQELSDGDLQAAIDSYREIPADQRSKSDSYNHRVLVNEQSRRTKQAQAESTEPLNTPESLEAMSKDELRSHIQELAKTPKSARNDAQKKAINNAAVEWNRRRDAEKEAAKATKPTQETPLHVEQQVEGEVESTPASTQEEAAPQQETPPEPTGSSMSERQVVSRKFAALNAANRSILRNELLQTIPYDTLIPFLAGDTNAAISPEDLRIIDYLADEQLAIQQEESQQAQAQEVTAPVTEAEPTQPTTPVEPEAEPLSLKEQITQDIANNADNVRVVNFRGKDRNYVLIDGQVYNENGNPIISETITKHFDEGTVADPDSIPEPTTEAVTDSDTKSEDQVRAEEVFAKTKIGKALNFVADKTKLYTPDFMKDWVGKLSRGKPHEKAFAKLLSRHKSRIMSKFGTYDSNGIPTAESFLQKIHHTKDRQFLSGALNTVAKMKVLEEHLGTFIEDVEGWAQENLQRTKKKSHDTIRAEHDRAILDVLVQHMPEPEARVRLNALKADMVSKNPTHRMLDLFEYDAELDQYSIPDEVMNAAALSIMDYVGNFRNHVHSYDDAQTLGESIGVRNVDFTYTVKGEPGVHTGATHLLKSHGFTTFRNAVSDLARVANTFLGATPKSNVGEGYTHAPMYNLMGTLLEDLSIFEGALTPFAEVELTNDDGTVIPLLIGLNMESNNKNPSQAQKDLEEAQLATDIAIREVLNDPERIRYIDKIPPVSTRDRQGNKLTRKQQIVQSIQESTEYRVNVPMHNLWSKVLGKDGVIEAFGYPEASDPNHNMNRYDRESKEGKNLQLVSAIQEAQALQQEMEDMGLELGEAPVRYKSFFSSVARLMMEGGQNPQGDKINRSFMSPHRDVVDATDFIEFVHTGSMAEANKTQKFLTLAYAQAFGVSLQNKTMEQIKEDLSGYLTEELLEDAAAWYQATQYEKQTDLTDLIQRTKEHPIDFSELAIQTLVELGQMHLDVDTANFTTHAYIEADGITNGPFMAGFILGIDVADPAWIKFMSNAGLYIGRTETSNDYRSGVIADETQTKPDNYQAVGDAGTIELNEIMDDLLKYAQGSTKPRVENYVESLKTVLKHSLGHIKINSDGSVEATRDTAKNPVTVTFYGSGANGIANKFVGEIQDFIHEMATAMQQSNDWQQLGEVIIKDNNLTLEQKAIEAQNLVNALQEVTQNNTRLIIDKKTKEPRTYYFTGKHVGLNINTFDPGVLSNITLNKKQAETLQGALSQTLVKGLDTALKGTASSTLEATQTVQKATDGFSVLAAAVFNKEIQTILNHPDYDPVEGISRAQVNQIKKKLTDMGLSGNITDALFSLVKETTSIDDVALRVSTLSGKGMRDTDTTHRGVSTLGVSGIPRFVISMGDAATVMNYLIEADAAGIKNTLQVYDGLNLDRNSFEEGSKIANEAVLKSVTSQPLTGLVRQLEKGMVPLLKELGIDPKNPPRIHSLGGVIQLVNELKPSLGKSAAIQFVDSILASNFGTTVSHSNIEKYLNKEVLPDYVFKRLERAGMDMQIDPVFVADVTYESYQDLRDALKVTKKLPLAKSQMWFKRWQEVNPELRGMDYNSFMESTDNKTDLELYAPTNRSPFSLNRIRDLNEKVIKNHEALKNLEYSVDQMAGVGQSATHEGRTLDSTDPEVIAEEAQKELQKVQEQEESSVEKLPNIKLDKGTWVKDGNETVVGDFRRLSDTLSDAFEKTDLRSNVAKRVVILAERHGVRIEYNPNQARGSHYNPSNNTVYLKDLSPETILHELIHSVVTSSLNGHYFGTHKLTREAQQAIKNLETLLDEVNQDPDGVTSTHWGKALGHVNQARRKYTRQLGAEAGKAAALNELLAIWLSDPQLALEAQEKPVKSMLGRIARGVMNAFRSLLRMPDNTNPDTLFYALASNMHVLAYSPITRRSEHGLSDSADTVLDMFEPDEATGTARLYREMEDLAYQGMSRLDSMDEALTLTKGLDAVDTVGSLQAAGFNMDANQQKAFKQFREAFVLAADLDKQARANMYRMATHIFRKIKPEHFGDVSVPGSPEYYEAHNKHAAITGASSGSRQAMVVDAIALALTNQDMMDAVNQLGAPQAEKSVETESTWERRLGQLGYDTINKLTNVLSGVRGNDVPVEALQKMMESFVKKSDGEVNSFWNLPGNAVDKANELFSEGLTYMGNAMGTKSEEMIRSENKLANASGLAIGAVGSLLSTDTASTVAESLLSRLNQTNNMQSVKTILVDMIGRTDGNARVYDMIKLVKSHVQKLRQTYVEGTPLNIYKQFSKRPTDAQMSDLNTSMAKNDLAAVAEVHGAEGALELLSNTRELNNRINTLEGEIRQTENGELVLEKAHQLAHYLNTGETGNNLLINAEYIAKLYGTDAATSYSPELVAQIDELVSLQAFKNTDNSTFRTLLKNEHKAIHYILSLQAGIRKEEKAKEGFATHPGIKGYVPVSSSGSMRIIPDDLADKYIKRGYVRVADYQSSRLDRDRSKRGYYVSPLSESRPFAQGIIQNAIATSNGIEVGTMQPLGDNLSGLITDPEYIESIRDTSIKENAKFGLVPFYNSQGFLVGMSRAVDPKVLSHMNRETNLAENLGDWRGRQVEELVATTFNEVIVDELEASYKEDVGAAKEYVNILDPKTWENDAVLKDAVSVLSSKAKEYAQDKYGRMMVRRDMLTNLVGYRQMGIADIWTGVTNLNPEIRAGVQRALEQMFGPKAYKYLVQGEEVIRGLVGDAKQLIVVKSVIIPIINGLSNIVHLVGRGVPIADIVKGVPRKIAEIEQYVSGSNRIIEIEAEILATEGNPAKVRGLEAERASIMEYHKTLSIFPLIQAGEFTSIVSAKIDMEATDLSKGKVAEYLENQINKLDGGSKTLAKNLLITKDTALYQFLQKSVDYGDFVAKALIYDDIVHRQGKSQKAAHGAVKEEFINYDYLPGRLRGTLEGLGILWFFNFKMRSTKIALSMIRENPLHTVLAMGAIPMSTPFGNLGIPIDDNVFYQTGEGVIHHSIGPGMGMRSWGLHPVAQVMF